MAPAAKRNRVMNRSRVLRAVWQRPLQSRVEIAALLGLDKSTVSGIINELIEHGLVREVAEGNAAPKGGRRPVHLEVVAGFGSVLGLDLQPGLFRAALCDMHGAVLRQWKAERPRDGASFGDYLLSLIDEILEDLGDDRARLLGIGVAMGGLINSLRNEVAGSIPMRLPEYDFQREISDRFDIPVIVENDANACAWGELTFHRSQNVHDFLYVLVQMRTEPHSREFYGGLGVGIGIVINGTLHPGTNFAAGEFRSVLYDGQGGGQFSLTDEEAFRVPVDAEVRSRFFRELAANVALIVNVLNVNHLFIGGDIVAYRDDVQPVFQQELQRNWPYESPVQCELHFSSFGENAVVYGAAGMLLERFFSDQIFPIGDIRNRHGRAEVLDDFNDALMRADER